MKNLILLSFSLALFLLSCTKPEEEPFFEVQGSDFTLSGNERVSDSIQVLTNIGWRAVITPKEVDWPQVSPALGNKTSAIVVTTTKQNFSGAPRTAFIDVIPSDTVRFVPRQYLITQNSLSPELSTNVATLNLAGTIDATGTFTIQSNLNWSITTTADWLTINSANGSNNATIEVKATKANNYRTARIATLVIAPIGNNNVQPVIITVSQASISPSVDWSKNFGGEGTERMLPILKTTDGGYVMAGTTRSKDRDAIGNHGSQFNTDDGFVVKVDANGNKVWSKVYGGTGNDILNGMSSTSDGGFILVGSTKSRDGDIYYEPNTPFNGLGDAWILRIDGSGNVVWSKVFGGSDVDEFHGVVTTNGGEFIAVGFTASSNRDLEGNPRWGINDSWLFKVDANGNKMWSKLYGGSKEDKAYAIAKTLDGSFVMAGISFSKDGDAIGNSNTGEDHSDGFIIKVDQNGNKIWSKVFGGLNHDEFYTIISNDNGSLMVAGSTMSNDANYISNMGGRAIWLMQIDASGNQQWNKLYGGSSNDHAETILKTSDGGYIIVGVSNSTDGDFTANIGGLDACVLKLDNNGNKIWFGQFGGMQDDFGMCVIENANNSYVLSGWTSSSNGDLNVNYGNTDAWMLKFKLP